MSGKCKEMEHLTAAENETLRIMHERQNKTNQEKNENHNNQSAPVSPK